MVAVPMSSTAARSRRWKVPVGRVILMWSVIGTNPCLIGADTTLRNSRVTASVEFGTRNSHQIDGSDASFTNVSDARSDGASKDVGWPAAADGKSDFTLAAGGQRSRDAAKTFMRLAGRLTNVLACGLFVVMLLSYVLVGRRLRGRRPIDFPFSYNDELAVRNHPRRSSAGAARRCLGSRHGTVDYPFMNTELVERRRRR